MDAFTVGWRRQDGRMVGAFTHVVKFDGGDMVSQIGPRSDRNRFAAPLRRQDGENRWGLGLFRLPETMSYDEMLAVGEEFTEYLQAGGSADRLTVEIRKPGGGQWNCQWVRYVVGHPHDQRAHLDVETPMPNGAVRVSSAEVFEAEEAADLFAAYHQTGDLPDGYTLRPVDGYTADGTAVEIPDSTK
jgi:hypothetical protein